MRSSLLLSEVRGSLLLSEAGPSEYVWIVSARSVEADLDAYNNVDVRGARACDVPSVAMTNYKSSCSACNGNVSSMFILGDEGRRDLVVPDAFLYTRRDLISDHGHGSVQASVRGWRAPADGGVLVCAHAAITTVDKERYTQNIELVAVDKGDTFTDTAGHAVASMRRKLRTRA